MMTKKSYLLRRFWSGPHSVLTAQASRSLSALCQDDRQLAREAGVDRQPQALPRM
jgi:hypothetical protein